MGGLEIRRQDGEGATATADRNTLIGDIMGVFIMYVVYYSPSDYPGEWVVRKFTIEDLNIKANPELYGSADSLEELRSLKPKGMIIVDRHDKDDPVIWETWI